MKILSLNVNNFSGCNCKKDKKYRSVSEWREINIEKFIKNSSSILEYLQKEDINPDIVILHEFELDTVTCTNFIKKMEKIGFKIIPYSKPEYNNSSITIMFIKKDIFYTAIDNPHNKNLRASIIGVLDYIVYGVHCPIDINFWNELIKFYKEKKEQKILIIGDLNIYDYGTEQKQKYCELLDEGAKDAWIEKGYPHEKATFNSGKRIDYAIMSPILFNQLNKIIIDDTLRARDITDHSTVIVEI